MSARSDTPPGSARSSPSLSPDADISAIQAAVSKALLALTRTTNSLAAADVPFQKSLDPGFEKALLARNARLRAIVDKLVHSLSAASDRPASLGQQKQPDAPASVWHDPISSHRQTKKARQAKKAKPSEPRPEDEEGAVEALDRNWAGIVDILDGLLEKADSSLDEYTGLVKKLTPADIETAAALSAKSRMSKQTKVNRFLDIPKPQSKFDQPVDNNSLDGPFKPLLQSKPHATVPLEESLELTVDYYGRKQYAHPYKAEIEQYQYPQFVSQHADPIMYTPFETTTAVWVDTPEAMDQMIDELKQEKLIAIDLEHHDYRTYVGLLSLMQISSRKKDWIVDTLQPWRHKLQKLNEVFTDPSIVKVFHGAMMDIIWLQRDLGLYIVGLFDTGHAARALHYPAASLAFLLQKFVNFDAQKQYQMADWRARPLSPEMFDYARSDTHFLLYIYDCVRNELLSAAPQMTPEGPESRLAIVSRRSKETSLQTYTHLVYDKEGGQGPNGWYKLIARSPVPLSPSQFEVYRTLHAWRDQVARDEDEGIQFIMSNNVLSAIVKALPADTNGLLAANPYASPIFRSKASEILTLIQDAVERGKSGPSMIDVLESLDRKYKQPARTDLSVGNTVKILKLESAEKQKLNPSATPFTSTSHSGIQTLQRLNPANKMKLRSLSSSFWGNVLSLPGCTSPTARAASTATGSQTGSAKEPSQAAPNISLPIPLPNLTALVFEPAKREGEAEESPAAKSEDKTEEAPAAHKYVPSTDRQPVKEDEEVFVVRQLGLKKSGRRSKKDSEASAPHQDDTDAPQTADAADPAEAASEAPAEKPRRAKGKKGSKAAATADEGAGADEPTAPFDYTAAASVLGPDFDQEDNNKSGRKKRAGKQKGTKRPASSSTQKVDPYARLNDAPEPERKRRKEAGKSGTWA